MSEDTRSLEQVLEEMQRRPDWDEREYAVLYTIGTPKQFPRPYTYSCWAKDAGVAAQKAKAATSPFEILKVEVLRTGEIVDRELWIEKGSLTQQKNAEMLTEITSDGKMKSRPAPTSRPSGGKKLMR